MKIAQIAPVWKKLPPERWGGTERIVVGLTETLVRKGYDVTLFATADSQTSATLLSTIPTGVLDSGGSFHDGVAPLYHLLNAIDRQDDFDVMHFHFTSTVDYTMLALIRDIPHAIVTFHVPLPTGEHESIGRQMLESVFSKIAVVSLSNDQRKDLRLNFIATIHNGVDATTYAYKAVPESEHIVWLSRISRLKGTREAVEAAIKTNHPITIIGEPNLKAEPVVTYFEEIKPLLSQRLVTYKASLPQTADMVREYQDAKVFLFPLQWEEPFGLVIIEAMSCGTPVIAFARGSMSEIIQDGKTGFLINPSDSDKRGDWVIKETGMAGLQEAIKRVYALSADEYLAMRQAARARVQEYFTTEIMVGNYERIYTQIVANLKK